MEPLNEGSEIKIYNSTKEYLKFIENVFVNELTVIVNEYSDERRWSHYLIFNYGYVLVYFKLRIDMIVLNFNVTTSLSKL